MYYLQFEMPLNINAVRKSVKWKDFLEQFIIQFVKKVLPVANPDYEEQLENVRKWVIEFDSETNIPNREIGLDETENTIMTLPNDNNYGYWTDNILTRIDFENHFEVEEVAQEYFIHLWNDFERNQ